MIQIRFHHFIYPFIPFKVSRALCFVGLPAHRNATRAACHNILMGRRTSVLPSGISAAISQMWCENVVKTMPLSASASSAVGSNPHLCQVRLECRVLWNKYNIIPSNSSLESGRMAVQTRRWWHKKVWNWKSARKKHNLQLTFAPHLAMVVNNRPSTSSREMLASYSSLTLVLQQQLLRGERGHFVQHDLY